MNFCKINQTLGWPQEWLRPPLATAHVSRYDYELTLKVRERYPCCREYSIAGINSCLQFKAAERIMCCCESIFKRMVGLQYTTRPATRDVVTSRRSWAGWLAAVCSLCEYIYIMHSVCVQLYIFNFFNQRAMRSSCSR